VALKVQTLKYDARTHKAMRHSWSSLNKKKTKTQLQRTSSMPVESSPFTNSGLKISESQIRRSHAQSDKAQLVIIEKQKNENSTSANIVKAIRILAFDSAHKVALKVQNLKDDARTHKVRRHSWSSLNNKNKKLKFSQHRQYH